MSIKELRRRKVARAVFTQAWSYNKKTELYRLSFASSLKLAWKTVRSIIKLIHTKLRGVTHGGRQLLLQRLNRCTLEQVALSFKRDYNNAYDRNAVQIIATSVKTGSSAILGYLSSKLAVDVANALDKGRQAVILTWGVTGADKQFCGCNLTYAIQ
ncbi:MAG: hypothetical protein A2Y23_07130 [Clostridiales bacterium GWB2_37_7]|nr:MAG: hypothetical protein A2Y23_07130 [Clostridiales bacterium GWB2_37_7]